MGMARRAGGCLCRRRRTRQPPHDVQGAAFESVAPVPFIGDSRQFACIGEQVSERGSIVFGSSLAARMFHALFTGPLYCVGDVSGYASKPAFVPHPCRGAAGLRDWTPIRASTPTIPTIGFKSGPGSSRMMMTVTVARHRRRISWACGGDDPYREGGAEGLCHTMTVR